MSILETFGKSADAIWQKFITQEHLSEQEASKFERYLLLLREWNERINITRIIQVPDIVAFHFQDSIRIKDFIDIAKKEGICDVGSGGGFPGIPLSILFPEVPMVLLEVNTKKIAFLETVIDELELKNSTVCSLDWRTLLRDGSFKLDLFCARASLKPEELLRLFKPGCPYKGAQLVYWASKQWEPNEKEAAYLVKKEIYKIDSQQRVFAFFSGNLTK